MPIQVVEQEFSKFILHQLTSLINLEFLEMEDLTRIRKKSFSMKNI